MTARPKKGAILFSQPLYHFSAEYIRPPPYKIRCNPLLPIISVIQALRLRITLHKSPELLAVCHYGQIRIRLNREMIDIRRKPEHFLFAVHYPAALCLLSNDPLDMCDPAFEILRKEQTQLLCSSCVSFLAIICLLLSF